MGSAVRLAVEVGLSRSFELHCRVTVELLSSYCRFFCLKLSRSLIEARAQGAGLRFAGGVEGGGLILTVGRWELGAWWAPGHIGVVERMRRCVGSVLQVSGS